MTIMNQQKNRWAAGFTLMEMMAVVVIIGIIAAMAVPSFLNYMPKLRIKSNARDIVSQLRLARSRAVSERQPYGVAFALGTNAIYTFKDIDDPTSKTYSSSDSVMRADTLGADVSLVSCTYADNCVVFNSTGAASTSGDLQLVTGDGSIVMSINVLASTGRVRLTEIGS